jgi:hypothetical protein
MCGGVSLAHTPIHAPPDSPRVVFSVCAQEFYAVRDLLPSITLFPINRQKSGVQETQSSIVYKQRMGQKSSGGRFRYH